MKWIEKNTANDIKLKVAAECNVIWTQFMGPQVQLSKGEWFEKGHNGNEKTVYHFMMVLYFGRPGWPSCECGQQIVQNHWGEHGTPRQAGFWGWWWSWGNGWQGWWWWWWWMMMVMQTQMQIDVKDGADWFSLIFGFRWTFDIACAHLYYLMTSDSYSRWPPSYLLF